nr:sporamin B-like isoform X2 [Ipomoea trifida]
MKTLTLLLALSLYLLPNPTHSTRNPIRLPTVDTPVLDNEGDALLPGRPYMLRSWKWTHGGLRLVSLDGATTKCPSDVIISTDLDDEGSPVVFTPADPDAPVVSRSAFLNIKFAIPTVRLCVSNVSWEVEYDEKSGQRLVKAGDVLSYQFKIESVAPVLHAYKFSYCDSGTDNCYVVGPHYGPDQQTRLALGTDEPYSISFMKAPVPLNDSTKCARNVVMSPPLTDGDPIRITPADPNATVVSPSTFQSFAFSVPTSRLCVSSVFWGIRFDRASRKYFLNSGEFVSNLSGQFKIEVVTELNAYEITYCPFGGDKCYSVGRYYDEAAGADRLALTQDFPFTVVFKKARF